MKGLEAQKANILAAKAVCNILKTSLGPKGAALPGAEPPGPEGGAGVGRGGGRGRAGGG